MPVDRADTHQIRTFRGFKASPFTDAARISFEKRASKMVLSRTIPSSRIDDKQRKTLDPDVRRKWMEVEGLSAKHARDLLRIQECPQIIGFSSLPIENKGQVSHAYEFFKNVYVPTNSASPGFKTYYQVVLQDAMLFEQMMAYNLAMENMDKAPTQRMTAPGLYHSNRSVRQLRERLQASHIKDRTSDAVVMTILLLIAFHVICDDLEPWSLHMKALRRVTAVRGGSDKLGWEGFLHTKVAQAEAAWTTFEARETNVKQAETGLTYPNHPFSPALCHQISKLPSGFRELALRSRLSLQFIGMLEKNLHRMKDDNAPSSIAIISVMEHLITQPKVTSLERILAISILSCSIFKAKAHEGIPPSIEIARQLHARSFPLGRGKYSEGSPEEDSLDWAAFALRATTDKDSAAWNWGNQRINSGRAGLALESKISDLQETLLVIPT